MTKPHWSQQELFELWLRANEEPISDVDCDALNQLIASDSQARECIFALSQQQTWLMWHGSLDDESVDEAMPGRVEAAFTKVASEHTLVPAASPVTVTAPLMPQEPATRCWNFALATCVGVLVAVVGMQGWMLYRRSLPDSSLVGSQAMAAPVGYLAMVNGCVWGSDGSRLHSLGSGVQQGDEISLQEGIAEFRMASGVLLSIEGPAALVLTSSSSFVLQYGKITTHVPWTVADFKAVVGTCILTAYDSEFGISFFGRNVDVHAFSGNVEAVGAGSLPGNIAPEASAAPSVFLARSRIAEGHSLTLAQHADGMKVVTSGAADEVRFATRLPMAWPLPVLPDYVDAVMASKPVGYWRFESSEGGVVKSEVATGSDLNVIGDLRLSGNDDNHVAEFNQPGTGARLISREPTDILSRSDYSVEVWIKPSHLHCGGAVALLATPPDVPIESHAFYLELQGALGRGICSDTHPGCVRFLHRDPPCRDFSIGKSCLSEQPYRLRRWQHVVAVKEGVNMRLYVDGKLAGHEQVETNLAPRLTLVVGQPESDAPRDFWFVGQLDELAIYNRALTESEITTHYKTIRWKLGHQPVPVNGI